MPFLIDRKHISVHQALFLRTVYQATVPGTPSGSFQAFPIYEHPLYSIAGYFCWCKISWKCVLTLQKKFSWFLFLQNQCRMLWQNPYQYQCTCTMTSSIFILISLFSFSWKQVCPRKSQRFAPWNFPLYSNVHTQKLCTLESKADYSAGKSCTVNENFYKNKFIHELP